MTIEKVSAGEPIKFRAGDWNRLADVANAHRPGQSSGEFGQRHLGLGPIADVLNNSGSDRAQFDVMPLTGPAVTAADNAAEFLYNLSITSGALAYPGSIGRWGMALAPIKDGIVGPVAVQGIFACKLYLANDDHPFADIDPNDEWPDYPTPTRARSICSNWYGPAEILWQDGTTPPAEVYAIIRLGPFQSPIYKIVLDEDIAAAGEGDAYIQWAGANSELINVHNDHMNAGETAEDGQDGLAKFFRGQGEWSITEIEC